MHETHRLSWDGAVDADGHILEPSDLWETYLEPRYRDRSLRIVKDENGLDVLEIDGTPSVMAARGMPSTLAAMGRGNLGAMARDPAITYDNHAPPAATEPKARLELLDAEHIDAAVLYTTTGLLWEAELTDVELSQAYCRAYNRWICEWCSDGEGRLVPTAHLSLGDPAAAARELERAVGEGARGGFVAPFTHAATPLGHPDNDPVFSAAQDLDVPLAIHPTFEPQWTKGTRMGGWENVRQLRLSASVQASDGVRHQFSTLFDYGVFDRFPRLKVLVLESGGGWIGYMLDRMDGVFGHTPIGEQVPLQHPPSHYFRTRCWISLRENRNAVLEDRALLCSPYRPSAGFSVGNAMARNKLVYAQSTVALVVAADEGSGGTWAGATEALKKRFVPVAVWMGGDAGPGNAALVERGARPVDALDDLVDLLAARETISGDTASATPAPTATQLGLDLSP